MRIRTVKPEFVDSVPTELKAGVAYVSLKNKTVLHLCCCGCGEEVETPLSPAEWSFAYDGEDLSLHPSIGNWALPCKSHYWITAGRIRWARAWTESEVRESGIADSQAFEEMAKGPEKKRKAGKISEIVAKAVKRERVRKKRSPGVSGVRFERLLLLKARGFETWSL